MHIFSLFILTTAVFSAQAYDAPAKELMQIKKSSDGTEIIISRCMPQPSEQYTLGFNDSCHAVSKEEFNEFFTGRPDRRHTSLSKQLKRITKEDKPSGSVSEDKTK